MASKIEFTIKGLTEAKCPADKRWILVSDPKTPGLKLRVTKQQEKTYIYYRRLPVTNESAAERVDESLGRFSDLKLDQARVIANEWNRVVGLGKDPRAKHGELTYGQLFDSYIEQYAKHETTSWAETVRNHGHENFKRWINKPVSKMRTADIQAWLYDLATDEQRKRTHAGIANRSYDTMKAVLNWGRKKKLVLHETENPCVGIDKVPTKSRERFIQQGDEFAKFAEAMAKEPSKTWQDFFWVSLFVGARRANVLAMAWDQINFASNSWTIPVTKNGDSLTVPLTPSALEILKRRYDAKEEDAIWVFPSDRPSRKTGEYTHIVNPKEAWKRLLERAKITDLRIHDLRRTAGSYMAIQGVSPTIIGKALGHKSQAATAIYARLSQDPVMQAMTNAQEAMKNPSVKRGEVVELKQVAK